MNEPHGQSNKKKHYIYFLAILYIIKHKDGEETDKRNNSQLYQNLQEITFCRLITQLSTKCHMRPRSFS